MGAKMVEFNGWDMPVEYPPRSGAALWPSTWRCGPASAFLMSATWAIFAWPDREALAAVQHISMNDASRLAIGQAQYSALLYPQGTFVDDVIVHRLGEDEYLLVINAGTREKDFNWVRDNTRQFDCAVENLSDDFTQIAIQGPKAVDVLQKLTDADLSAVKFYWVTRGTVCGLKNILMGRTGYTAEDGFEIYIPPDERPARVSGMRFWKRGKNLALSPAAWGAQHAAARRQTVALRTRNLGHDQRVGSGAGSFLQDGEAGFYWTRCAGKGESRGVKKNAGRAGDGRSGNCPRRVQGSGRRGREIGYVTSGSPAPFLKKNIALAYVPPAQAAVGNTVKVEIRGQGVVAQVVQRRFISVRKKLEPGGHEGSQGSPNSK
jgi:aminomethyltransferase